MILRFVVDHDVMPAPRQVHNKRALAIPRHLMANKAVLRTKDYLANRDALAWGMFVAARGMAKVPPKVRLRCNVTIWLAHNRMPDKDNLEKGVLDALVRAGIIADDKWIRAGDVVIHDGATRGTIAVEIRLL
jgi:Holliday junction resolvase RusA-like endonuclease